MIIKIIPLIAAIAFIYIFYRYVQLMPNDKRKPFVIKISVYGVIAILILAVVTGRIHWLGGVLAGALAFGKAILSTGLRFFPLLKLFGKSQNFSNPVFNTKFLRVEYDLSNSKISGTIKSGPHSGQTLSSLKPNELDSLLAHYKENDKVSYYLLIAATKPANAQQSFEDINPAQNPTSLSVKECKLMLGLKDPISKADVDAAHRKLIQKLHPDRGGNDYLASRINLARDILKNSLESK